MTEELLGPMADALDPELVAPVVVYLASDQCDVTGQILSVAGGRVSRVVVAEPLGYYSKELTPEQVRDNWGTIAALDRKSTRLTPVTNAHLVCRLLLETKKTIPTK